MTDERNIAHDKTVAQDKKDDGQAAAAGQPAIVPQPGRKPPLIDADTDPSNSVAHELYKQGYEPRVHDKAANDDAAE